MIGNTAWNSTIVRATASGVVDRYLTGVAAMISERSVHSNGRDRGKPGGGAGVAAHRSICPRSQACPAAVRGARIRQWEEASCFKIIPGYSGLFRFLTKRRKSLNITHNYSYAAFVAGNCATDDRRRRIACFLTAIAA
jgi:hypothetical protein